MKFWNHKVVFFLPAASRFYLWWKPRSVVVAFSWVVADQILPLQVQFESEFFLGYLEKFPRNDWEISSMKCEMLWNRKIGFISLSFWALPSNFHQHFVTHSYLVDMHFISFASEIYWPKYQTSNVKNKNNYLFELFPTFNYSLFAIAINRAILGNGK